MDSRQPTLTRLRLVVAALAERAGATSVVLFAPRDTGLTMVVQHEVTQAALDLAHSAWMRKRELLQAGSVVRYGRAVVWPLFDGPKLVALVYLDAAPAQFPDDEAREHGSDLILRLRRLNPPSPVATYLATGLSLADAFEEVQRDQLALALELYHGNVTAAARLLGVTRETIYKRAHRLGLDIPTFRARRAPRR